MDYYPIESLPLATSKYLSFLQLNGSLNWTSYLIIKAIMMIAKAKIIIPANTPPYRDPVSTPVRSATSTEAAKYNDQISFKTHNIDHQTMV